MREIAPLDISPMKQKRAPTTDTRMFSRSTHVFDCATRLLPALAFDGVLYNQILITRLGPLVEVGALAKLPICTTGLDETPFGFISRLHMRVVHVAAFEHFSSTSCEAASLEECHGARDLANASVGTHIVQS